MWKSCRRPPAVSIDKGQRVKGAALCRESSTMVWLCGCEGVQVCLGCAVKTAEQSSWHLET